MSDAKFVLTSENYYSNEADRVYMSCSQYQDFLECEARALAKIEGRFTPKKSEALIVGNYFHTALESPEAHEEFCKENFDEIFKYSVNKAGEVIIKGKYAAFEKADQMIEVCKNDPLINSIIEHPGENEVIMTGEIYGVPWKIRLDKYAKDSRLIVDWKTTADINKTEYNPYWGERESFVEALGYMMRAAVYTEIEKQYTNNSEDADFVIVAVSKQDPPDKAALSLNHRQRYDWELDEIKKRLPRIMRVKNHHEAPKRCNACEYCRATKVLKKIIPYYVLNPKFKDEREEEVDYLEAFNMENPQ